MGRRRRRPTSWRSRLDVVSVLDSLGYNARLRFDNDPFSAESKLGRQVIFSGWFPDYPTPTGMIFPLTCAAYSPVGSVNLNASEFCDPAIEREITRARSLQTGDPAAALRLWAKVDRDLTDAAPWVAFSNGVTLDVKSPRVGNYQFNPQWSTLLDQLWVR
jgi:peptide/nickel transport system substrate-binding protein